MLQQSPVIDASLLACMQAGGVYDHASGHVSIYRLMIYRFSHNDVLDQMVLELCAHYSRVFATRLMLLNLMYLCKFILVYIFEL